MTKETRLFLSAAESRALGLKVARGQGVISGAEIMSLSGEIFQDEYDLCRLKIDGSKAETFSQLRALGFPFSLFAINYHNRISVPQERPLIADVDIAECTPADGGTVRDMLKEVLDTKGWIEYHSDWYESLVNEEKHQELALNYFSSFHDGQAGRRTWFLKYKGQNAGIFMGTKVDQVFFGTFYGILPAFRGEGLAGHLYTAMFNLCNKMGCNFFENEVNIFNIPSMKATVSSSMIPDQIVFNVMLFPLLSFIGEKGKTVSHSSSDAASFLLSNFETGGGRVTYFSSAVNSGGSSRSDAMSVTHHSWSAGEKRLEMARSYFGNDTYDLAYICLG